MFFSCFAFSLSKSVELNSTTAGEILNNAKGLPVFVEVWDPWCPHCKAFSESWNALASLKEFNELVVFADINSFSSRKLVKMFPGGATPRFFWIDSPGDIPKQYGDIHSFAKLHEFISKQLKPQFIDLTLENFQNMKKKRDELSYFIFNISANDKEKQIIANEATKRMKHLPVLFFITYNNGNNSEITAYIGSPNNIKMTDSWTIPNVMTFVKRNSVRFLTYFTDYIDYYTDINNIPIVIFVRPTNYNTLVSVREDAEYASRAFATSYTTCSMSPKLCRYVGVKGECVIVMYRTKKIFWVWHPEKGNFREWLKNVFELNEKPSGPGEGFMSSFFAMYYQMRGEGGIRFYAMLLPLIVSVIMLVVLIYIITDTALSKREMKTQEEKTKEE